MGVVSTRLAWKLPIKRTDRGEAEGGKECKKKYNRRGVIPQACCESSRLFERGRPKGEKKKEERDGELGDGDEINRRGRIEEKRDDTPLEPSGRFCPPTRTRP